MKKHRTLLAALLIWITALSLLSPAFADSTSPRQPIRPPHIGTNGRLVLPAPQLFPHLPTEVHTFFPNHHAYHYDARLYQEGIGKIGSTEGYTLSGDRAYHEIENILGRTPRWGEWAKDIQEQKAKKGGIQILGQLSKTGPQTTGDYNGYAEFDTYGKNTRANVQYEVFDKLLPLINNYNHLAERLEQTDYLSPQEKARHLDTHLQTQQHPILPSNPQYLKDLTRGITRTRQVREIIGAANQPLSHPLTPEQLTQIGQNAPYLDPSLSYLAHHTQRAEANFTPNQQDSWQRWNGETPTPPNLSPYEQQLNRSSGALDHLIGDRSTYLTQRSGLDEAAARAYRNLVPTDIQATVSQGQAAAARFGEDNPDFAAAFGYGTRVAGVAGGVKGIEKALRAIPGQTVCPEQTAYPRPAASFANPNCRPYRTTLRKPQKPCSVVGTCKRKQQKKQERLRRENMLRVQTNTAARTRIDRNPVQTVLMQKNQQITQKLVQVATGIQLMKNLTQMLLSNIRIPVAVQRVQKCCCVIEIFLLIRQNLGHSQNQLQS